MPSPTVYVAATPLAEARRRFLEAVDLRPLGREDVDAVSAPGRVTAGLVLAELSSPHYHASAMDGYALRAAWTFRASERTPVRLEVRGAPRDAGELTGDTFAVRVDTGDPLPAGCDAVVPLEDAVVVDGGAVELRAAVRPWADVRVQGEDIVAGQVLLGENHVLTEADAGLLLAAGVTRVSVRRRPVVTFIPTGDEIVSPLGGLRLPLEPGKILETNGTTARLTLEGWGATVRVGAPVPDDPGAIGRVLDEALAVSDMVLIGAGSSAGRGDYTARIVARRGKVLVHGVAVRPGKPVVLGVAERDAGGPVIPVIGLPGYPVSSALALELYARPIIHAWQGRPDPGPDTVEARLGRAIPSPLGVDEFVRVKVARLGPGAAAPYVAVPLPRGAGLLSSLSQADGTVTVPASREGLDAGDTVRVTLARPRAVIDRALLVSGSHDLLLDVLSSRLAAHDPLLTLSAGRVGSAGGLLSLRDGLCHMAGTHLLDEETGDYNVSWARRLLGGRPARLMTLAWRRQGLMVPLGNPRGIESLADLARPGVAFINRQRGSGTRVLLDYLLRTGGIDPASMEGYGREEGSHLGVASAVASGAADAGLGILAAAKALGLDFIPVTEERYDLAFLPEFAADPRFELLRRIIGSDSEFRTAAETLGGYDLRDSGKDIEL